MQVRAKAAEIEEAVYGPKQPTESVDPRPGVFLPEPLPKSKVGAGSTGALSDTVT